MKNKFLLAFCLIVFMYVCINVNNISICYASEVTYFRIIDDNTYLYKTAELNSTQNNVYFKLPNTYFVKVVSTLDNNVAKVLYDGIEGFVDISNMQKCYSTPNTPYPKDLTLQVLDVCNTVIYLTPSQESTYVGIIPFNATNIKYFGSITGSDEAMSWTMLSGFVLMTVVYLGKHYVELSFGRIERGAASVGMAVLVASAYVSRWVTESKSQRVGRSKRGRVVLFKSFKIWLSFRRGLGAG